MAHQAKRPSPILGAATALIEQASGTLVTRDSRFRHSFEAPIDSIRSDPGQARKVFSESEIKTLAATMAERGQLQPILLRRDPNERGRWIIVAGERRWRAAMLNGWTSILAIEHDGDPEVTSLIENLQRVDLTPVEEARALQHLIKDKGWTQSAAAESLGKSKAEVSAILRILTLPEDVLDAVLTSELQIPKSALVELARIEDPAERDRLLALARSGLLTVRAVRDAGTGEGRVDDDRPATMAPARSTPRLSLRAIDRMAEALRAVRSAGQPLGATEQERLVHLKEEIEALLGRCPRRSEARDP